MLSFYVQGDGECFGRFDITSPIEFDSENRSLLAPFNEMVTFSCILVWIA